MSTSNDGGPAFPLPFGRDPAQPEVNGLSLCDWFAGKAMQGMISNHECVSGKTDVAEHAYSYADAMLATRAKKVSK